MALPAGSFQPQSIICGVDERVQVNPTTSPPYQWICYLLIESADGRMYKGSGFKIHLPDVGRTAIVTCGHCTYKNGAYASKITVQFPGEQAAIEVRTNDLYAAPEYIKLRSPDYDYGLILLPGAGRSDDGFGWSAIVPDRELNNRLVTNCGYPGDKPEGTMWITGGKISRYTDNSIFYKNDTVAGQSGSPVYTWYGGYWTVLAVHSYGGCPNSATRFTVQMIYRFLEFMNTLELASLRSVKFPNVYLRCDGTVVKSFSSDGGGTVNCQYTSPTLWEKFYIYPVEVAPSSAFHSSTKVVLESAKFRNVFIRMNSKGMDEWEEPGGGEVNCQYSTPSTWESYFLRKEPDGSYSFRNVKFPHCYIRLDGNGVESRLGFGGGTVNCQYYTDPSSPASTWESYHKEVH